MAEARLLAKISRRSRANLLLLLVATVWGSAFVAQRVAAQSMNPFFFNGVRFLFGAAILAPMANSPWKGLSRSMMKGIALAGGLLFGASALQQIGIRYTTAGNAGFITGLYVVLVPVILLVFWRQRSSWLVWGAVLLAVIGMFLLSTGGIALRLASGDSLEFAGAFLWALHVIVIGLLVRSIPVFTLAAGQYLVCGVFNLVVAGFTGAMGFPAEVITWWPVVYTGVLSIGLGYTLQAVAQKDASPVDTSILLSLEAVFAAFFGWILLGERLTLVQLAGCGLMLAGIVLSQLAPGKEARDAKIFIHE
jgi:drug/metabolite transporter (DMT)-like permease